MTALRVIAIAIAIAGAIDPAFTQVRHVRPDVSLVVSGALPDAALADRVARALNDRFTVIRGAAFGPAAIVSVGFELPDTSADGAQPAFAVIPEPRAPFVAIDEVRAPLRGHLQSRIPITVRLHAVGANGRNVNISLSAGDVTIDKVTRKITGDDVTENVELSFVGASTGTATLRVAVAVDDRDRVTADVSTTVGDARGSVLFFDRRPSWMSTFVRRAVESDPRFVVTSRTVTSRGASSAEGRAPESLSLPSLDLFDVVVASAPEELTDADVAGLDGFMREKGGVTVLLLDQSDAVSGTHAFQRLTGNIQWTHSNRAEPTGAPAASERLTPAQLPLWAEPITTSIWRTAIGRGTLVVSGALDAWRYRDRDDEAFDRFWRLAMAEAVTRRGLESSVPVLPQRSDTSARSRELLGSWVASRHGQIVKESDLASLASALERQLSPPVEPQTVRPMRSAWWMAPFGLLLGAEWWLRRRRGSR